MGFWTNVVFIADEDAVITDIIAIANIGSEPNAVLHDRRIRPERLAGSF